VDLTLIDNGNSKLVARGGRQELLLTAQRYASPLDWANTRRTFDGGRLLYTNSNWTIDGFWLAPLVRDARNFDEANEDVAFYGVYSNFNALECINNDRCPALLIVQFFIELEFYQLC